MQPIMYKLAMIEKIKR